MTVFIIILAILFMGGLFAVMQGASNRFHWPEVPGQVVDFIESVSEDEGGKQITYIPVVKYTVKDKEYTSKSKYNMTWRERDFSKNVTVLYNPEKPEEIYLKDNTMFAGCLLLVISSIGLGIIIALNAAD